MACRSCDVVAFFCGCSDCIVFAMASAGQADSSDASPWSVALAAPSASSCASSERSGWDGDAAATPVHSPPPSPEDSSPDGWSCSAAVEGGLDDDGHGGASGDTDIEVVPPSPEEPARKRGRRAVSAIVVDRLFKEQRRPMPPAAQTQHLEVVALAHREGDEAMDAMVPLGALSRLLRIPLIGESHPLAVAFKSAASAGQQHVGHTDEDALEVARALLSAESAALQSQVVMAQALSMSKYRLKTRFHSLVAASFLASRCARADLDTQLWTARGSIRLIAYIDCARYDETPMLVKTHGRSSIAASLPTPAATRGGCTPAGDG